MAFEKRVTGCRGAENRTRATCTPCMRTTIIRHPAMLPRIRAGRRGTRQSIRPRASGFKQAKNPGTGPAFRLLCFFRERPHAIHADKLSHAFNLRELKVRVFPAPVHRVIFAAELFALPGHLRCFVAYCALSHWCGYDCDTLSFFPFVRTSFGSRTVRMPFARFTSARSGSTSWGSMMDLENRPQ